MKKNIRNYFIMGLLIFIIGLLSYLLIRPVMMEQTTITASGVVEKIQSIAEINTVEMYFNEIIDYKNAKMFKQYEIPFTKKSFIFTVKAKVKAGVNLSTLTKEKVKIQGKAITIRLPNPEITSKEILSYKAYDEKDGLFNEVTNEDTLKALEEFTKSLDQQAKENEIIMQAILRTENTLEPLLKSMGFEEVEIEWVNNSNY